jgi:uncharacterized protein (TIGR02001 family)
MQIKKLGRLAIAASLAMPVLAVPLSAQAELSGNIEVVSKYILRGIFEENSGAALQGGIDWAHESGFYLGWWGSSLSYTYEKPGQDPYTTAGFENDFYGGFAGEFGDFSYDIGLIQYYYLNVDDSDLTELLLGIGYGPVSATVQYLLTDGWWGNAGDAYWTLNYEAEVPYGFIFGATLGYYTYDDDDAGNSKADFTTVKSSNFRHLNLSLSHPIGDTGADVSATYIFAGKDREDTEYDDTIVFAISYAFDI